MPLLKFELCVLRRSACGWSCIVMPFSMTVTWSMLAGHYMTRWADRQHLCRVQTSIRPTLLIVLKVFNKLCLWFDSSKGKWGWSVWPPCKACSITESLVHDWNFSQVVSRWASSLTTNNMIITLLVGLYSSSIMFTSLQSYIIWHLCAEIHFPLLLCYRTVLCLWPWIRSMTLQCRPLDYWHLYYSQYSPSTLQECLIKIRCLA